MAQTSTPPPEASSAEGSEEVVAYQDKSFGSVEANNSVHHLLDLPDEAGRVIDLRRDSHPIKYMQPMRSRAT